MPFIFERQLHALHPEVDTVGGVRVSGARHGGGRGAPEDSDTAVLNMRRPVEDDGRLPGYLSTQAYAQSAKHGDAPQPELVPVEHDPFITAYHGSPHDFDRFSLDKIGTGEGAQAYGHGLYFAENEGVAKGYRNTLAEWKVNGAEPDPNNPSHIAAVTLKSHDGDAGRAVADLRTTAESNLPSEERTAAAKAIEMIQKGQKLPEASGGHMYQVNIKANPEHFLDWDKPIVDQHPDTINSLLKSLPESSTNFLHAGTTGRELHDALGSAVPSGTPVSIGKTDLLRQAGIPGIKYLDQGSRGAGEGSRNYVVFDDKLIDIVKKYAVAGMALPPAVAMAMSQQFEPVDHDPFQ